MSYVIWMWHVLTEETLDTITDNLKASPQKYLSCHIGVSNSPMQKTASFKAIQIQSGANTP